MPSVIPAADEQRLCDEEKDPERRRNAVDDMPSIVAEWIAEKSPPKASDDRGKPDQKPNVSPASLCHPTPPGGPR
jgi:hypothetical protein